MSLFDYSDEEIQAVKPGHLLSMEIEFTRRCNYRCPYCYAVDESMDYSTEMSPDEIRNAIEQARELGARKIVILGGEPLVYPKLREMIRFIVSLGMGAEIFTNGALMTEELADFFCKQGCRVVVKLNSFNAEVHDRLTGRPDSLKKAREALRMLQEAGFRTAEGMLCAATVLSTVNLDEAPTIWRWLREQGIQPYFECITPQGRLLEHQSLLPDPLRVEEIFRGIAQIDREFGFEWTPQPPLVGQKCFRHRYSCVVNSRGDVTPCVGLDEVIGSIREKPLREILAGSRILHRLRNYRTYIKEPCRSCESIEHCYGCRGAAWQMTGDYLAADPTCWKNASKQSEILSLPLDAEPFIPHRRPVAMVTSLLRVTDAGGDVMAEIRPDNIFLNADGFLDNAAIPELAAQAVAALNGFLFPETIRKGMLAEINRFECRMPIRAGEQVTASCRTESEFPPWYMITFRILGADNSLRAEGELKLCVPDDEPQP